MDDSHRNRKTNGRWTGDRRTFIHTAALTGTALAVTGTGAGSATNRGFPPRNLTEWSDPVTLGDGELRTFTTLTPSGKPKYQGVYLDRDALAGLPTAEELRAQGENGDPGDKYGPEGEALEIHHAWSQEFFVPFPEASATPFTFLGLTWNPDGHPPPGTYDLPHFDVHFHMLDADTVDAIEGLVPAEFTVPETQLPSGYVRVPEPDLDGEFAVVTDMGEHLVDPESPELTGEEAFTNTLIWGTYDPDGDGVGELTFVEPMLTKQYLEGAVGVERYEIAQPAAYPSPGSYPTVYSVRDIPSEDAIAITIEDFVRYR